MMIESKGASTISALSSKGHCEPKLVEVRLDIRRLKAQPATQLYAVSRGAYKACQIFWRTKEANEAAAVNFLP
jgi:hypothetical protein